MLTYQLADGDMLSAATPEQFFERLRTGSAMQRHLTPAAYMAGFRNRVWQRYAVRLSTNPATALTQLIQCGYATPTATA